MEEEIEPVQQQNPGQTKAQKHKSLDRCKLQSGTRQAEDEDRKGIRDEQDCKDSEEGPQRIEAKGFGKPAMDDMPEAACHPAGQARDAREGVEGTPVEIGEAGWNEPGRGQRQKPDCAPYHFMVHTRFG